MRKYSVQGLLVTAAVFIAVLPAAVTAQEGGQEIDAVVRSLSGTVEFQETGGDWQPLVEGYELPLGARISTGFGSSAVLELGLAVLEVDSLSRLTIEELVEREGVIESDLYLESGRVRADVSRTEVRRQDFRLRSTVATAAVRGTSFEFDGRNLDVTTGIVELANLRGRSSTVPAGYRSRVLSGSDKPKRPQEVAREDTEVETDTGSQGRGDSDDDSSGFGDDDDEIVFDSGLPESGDEYGTLVIEIQ